MKARLHVIFPSMGPVSVPGHAPLTQSDIEALSDVVHSEALKAFENIMKFRADLEIAGVDIVVTARRKE